MASTPLTVAPARPDDVVLASWAMPPDISVHALIDYRRGQVRRREYRPLGKLEKVMLEGSGVFDISGANPLTNTRRQSAHLDYYNSGPLVGLSSDGVDVLICSAMHHPPDLPDPDWKPAYPPVHFKDGLPVPEIPPRIPQRLRDRASGMLPARERAHWAQPWTWFAKEEEFWFVFQPVTQVLLIMPGTGLAMIECSADPAGRHAALLYNPQRLEGHLLFGSKQVETYRA